MRQSWVMKAAAALMAVGFASGAEAVLVFGPDARTMFEGFRDNQGDTFIDFESVANGPLTALPGITFRTHIARFGSIGANQPVAVLPWDFVQSNPTNNRIVGTRSSSIPDGQNAYEIVFDTPQRRAGIFRIWNTSSITRFYSGAGDVLLDAHQNTVNQEFVGYIAESDDPTDWVKRIEIDGAVLSGTFQVGDSDDLFFGSTPVPAPTAGMMALIGLVGLRYRRR